MRTHIVPNILTLQIHQQSFETGRRFRPWKLGREPLIHSSPTTNGIQQHVWLSNLNQLYVSKATINHILMVDTNYYLWWFWGWFTVALLTLVGFGSNYFQVATTRMHRRAFLSVEIYRWVPLTIRVLQKPLVFPLEIADNLDDNLGLAFKLELLIWNITMGYN